MAAESSSPSKPSSPPPPYTEVADPALHGQPSAMSIPVSGPNTPIASPFPTHAAYGPTPIQQQTQLLPYYDPRSPYAIAEANSRARWRFITALFWAIVLLALMSFLTGYEVSLRMRGIHHGGWIHGSDRAEW